MNTPGGCVKKNSMLTLGRDAPAITRIVVQRNGQDVPPLANLLTPMTFTNGSGDQASLHGGEVRFPVAAFAPGGTVTVTAVPLAGTAFVASLTPAQLETLK